jgi:predicted O-methyltransferase YrrM
MVASSRRRRIIPSPVAKYVLARALRRLPPQLAEPLTYLEDRRLSEPDRLLCDHVEAMRAEIASRPGSVTILYSPRPGSAGSDHSPIARPVHGEATKFTFARIAGVTSVDAYWGRFLFLLAKTSRARNVLELGACAGISAAYLASAPNVEHLVSVEASPELAAVAAQTVAQVNPRAEVITGLFDDALDEVIPTYSHDLDLAWIDGHHERIATLHYFERIVPTLRPGAIVLFDDIAWSADMAAAWSDLRRWQGATHAIHLGKCGLLVWQGGAAKPLNIDLRLVTGKGWRVGQPAGWE